MKQKLRLFTSLLLLAVASMAWGEEETLTFPTSTGNVSMVNDGISVTGTYVSVSITKGSGSNLATNSDGSRVYNGNSIVFSSTTKKIAKIVFTYNRNKKLTNGITANVGSFTTEFTIGNSNASDLTATWEASDQTTDNVTFTVGSGGGNYALKTAVVTYVDGGSTTETVATPTFNPAAGTYTEAKSVTISCATTGATIYYTTNGDTPTTDSNVYSSAINVSETTTIKAIAVKAGMGNSAVASATYTIVEPFVIEDGVFDFESKRSDYGSGVSTTSANEYIEEDKTWTAGNVTLVTSGKYRWWDNDGTLRFYSNNPASAMTFSVPEGKVIKSIVITGGQNFTANVGTYTSGTWTGQAQTVTLSYAASSGSVNVKTITVTYGDPENVKVDIATINGISPVELTVGDNGDFTLNATFAEGVTDEDYTIAWASENTDVVGLDGKAYEAKAAGTANVTVTITPTDTEVYNAVSKSFEIVVSEKGDDNFAMFDATVDKANTGSTAGAWSISKDGFTISSNGGIGGNGSDYRIYKNNTFTVSSTNASVIITKIEFTATSDNPTTGFGDVDGFNEDKTVWTGNTNSVSFTASAKQVRLTKVKVYYEIDESYVAVPEFSIAEGTYIGEQNVEINCATEDASIHYTLNGDEPSAQSAIYESAITISNNTTIKAIAVKGENVSDIAVAEYTIVVPEHAGTVEDPFTTEDANLVAAANPKDVYVKGIISNIKSLDVSRYKRAQYYISDNGTEENEFYVFNGYYLNGADFTSNSQIQVGDIVIVKGNLTVYNETKEFAADNKIVDHTVVVDENSENKSVWANEGCNVQILRTFGKDYWNTFVMPFNGVTRAQLMNIFGSDVKIKAVKVNNDDDYILTGVSGNTISFSDYTDYSTGEFQNSLNYIYLIKPSQDVVNPVFTNITSTAFATTMSYSSEDGNLKIVGSPNKIAMTADEGFTAYYLSTAGSLKKASATATLKGTRFYFQTKDGVEAKVFIDDEATSIEAIDNGEQASGKQEIFNLAGQRVNKAQKGIYIVNGKKVVIR